MQFRNGMDETDNETYSLLTGLEMDPEEDRAVQSDAKEADINEIIRRFRKTGVPPRAGTAPVFGDYSEGFDLATAFLVQREATEAFEALGAAVRRRFGDDPLELAAFLSDPENREEAETLGLVRKAPVAPIPADPAPVSP